MKKILKIAALCGLLTIILLATVSCRNILGNLFGGNEESTTPEVTTPEATTTEATTPEVTTSEVTTPEITTPEITTPETTTQPHAHAFGEWTTTQNATCTEKGQQERICTCGEKEAQEINALGHNEVVDAAVAKTCTTDGLTAGSHCSVCGEVFVAQEVIPAAHDWMQLALLESATCFTYGEERRSCRVCGVVENAPIAPLAHDFVKNDETQTHICSLCNGVVFAGHLYAAFEGEYHWFDAYELCEEMGGHLATITSKHEQAVIDYLMNSELRAGLEYWIGGIRLSDGFYWVTGEFMEYQNWDSHQPDFFRQAEFFMGVYSTLSQSWRHGFWHDMNYECRIGFVYECNLNIEKCEHTFTEWETTIEPTCWNDGEQHRICTYCGMEETEVLAKLEHSFVLNEESGIEMCEHCNASKYNGHIYMLFTDTCGWFEAYSRCEALGGHLVTITSEEEQTFVCSYLQSVNCQDSVWLGGYTIDAKVWRWVTDEAFEYTHWLKGEPNNQGQKEWMAHLYNNNFEWNDEPPAEKYVYICEFECEE